MDELTALLEAAQQIAPDVVPTLALGAFAGVRTDIQDGEIERLDWTAIDLERGQIDGARVHYASHHRNLYAFEVCDAAKKWAG